MTKEAEYVYEVFSKQEAFTKDINLWLNIYPGQNHSNENWLGRIYNPIILLLRNRFWYCSFWKLSFDQIKSILFDINKAFERSMSKLLNLSEVNLSSPVDFTLNIFMVQKIWSRLWYEAKAITFMMGTSNSDNSEV